jgi:uncharacterized membrane protein YbhN (UPF0104 family)
MVHKNEIGQGAPSPEAGAAREVEASELHRSPGSRTKTGWSRLRSWLHVVVPLCVIALVVRELSAVDWQRAYIEIGRASPLPIAWAGLLTVVCVASMGFYDVLAMKEGSAYSTLDRWLLGAAICSWTNFLAIGPLAGPALRLHFYRRAGMSFARVISGLAGIYAGMFAGIAAWIVAVFVPLPEGALGSVLRASLAVLLAPILCVAAGAVIRRFGRNLSAERWTKYAALGAVGGVEWALVAAVYTLVGRSVGVGAPIASVARSFFIGHVAGAASLLPGGLGSADTVWLKLNVEQGSPSSIAAAQVLLFRCVYFLGPWSLSIVATAIYLGIRALRRGGAGPSGSETTRVAR